MDCVVELTLKEIDHPEQRIRTREIDGCNLIMENGEMASTESEQQCEIMFWMEERGEAQHNSRLELISYKIRPVIWP